MCRRSSTKAIRSGLPPVARVSQRFSTVFARFERPPAPTGLPDAVGSEAGPADGEWKAVRHLRNLPDEVSGILYFGINVCRDTILPRRSIWRSVASRHS